MSMKRRALGRTGEELSIIGLGGIVVSELPQAEANRIVSEAVDLGVNYFDVAPTYGDAEERLGPALEPYRGKSFLVGKTAERDGAASARELETTLRHLRTDYLDLYQLHGLVSKKDVEAVFSPGGAMETFRAAKEAGKVRFLGFSAHSTEAALETLKRFPFDTVLFPFNFVCWYQSDFGPAVMSEAKKRGAGRLALKAMARSPYPDGKRQYDKCWYLPFEDRDEAELALRWTLSQEVTAAVPPGEPRFFRWALEMAQDFRPLSVEEVDQLRGTAKTLTPIFPQ
jgi:predicted aldo/keto reductase-like oxidoreductase